MSTSERRRERDDRHDRSGGSDPGGTDGLQNEREEAERLFDQVDDITRRALAGNSAAFLRAGRQQGGQ